MEATTAARGNRITGIHSTHTSGLYKKSSWDDSYQWWFCDRYFNPFFDMIAINNEKDNDIYIVINLLHNCNK